MALEKITQVSGRGVFVPGDDVDTDRIIPARFMKCVTFDGLGDYFFYDVRFNEDGSRKKHQLNDQHYAGATILITGNNFGCGSSREHAPQAIRRAGFKGVIGEGFAEIFFGNSTQLGMPCVTVSSENREKLQAAVEADPQVEITIDLQTLTVSAGHLTIPCTMRDSNCSSLMEGKWDPLEELLEGNDAVDAMSQSLEYTKS